MPDRYVLIGDKVSNSPTPRMMTAAFGAMAMNAVYEAIEVRAEQLVAIFDKLKSSGVSGLNITIPHKTSIIHLLDSLDKVPNTIGAVNTVKRMGSDYRGYNTDVDGVMEPLKSRGLSRIRRAFVIGTGGASRAACRALYELGCKELMVLSRKVEMATNFLSSMKAAFPEVALEVASINNPPAGKPEVIFNASPIGANGIPLPTQVLPMLERRPTVFDAVYYPVETELIREAKKRHCVAIYGHEMLLHQGAKALQIWTDRSPQVEVMRTALLQSLGVAA